MIWLASLLLSFLLIKLGAMSVLLVVMSLALKVALALIALLIGLQIWRWYRKS